MGPVVAAKRKFRLRTQRIGLERCDCVIRLESGLDVGLSEHGAKLNVAPWSERPG